MKKFLLTILIIGGLVFLGWHIYQKISNSRKTLPTQAQNISVAVEVSPIKKGTIKEIGSFTGSLYPLSEFILAPKISGRLEKILANIGDKVESGQLVAKLDDDEYFQQVIQAKSELEVARANLQECKTNLEKAEKEYKRTFTLWGKKIASESQLDAAEAEFKAQQAKLKVARANVSQKAAALKGANIRLSYTQIHVAKNNSTGYRLIGERFVDEGAMLAPNTPIVSVIDIEKLIAVIHVIERDYSKIKVGFEAIISTDAFPDRTFTGRVIRIAPLLKEKSREARVEIEIPNPEKLLKPGMFVRVEIQFDKHEKATLIPVQALIKRNDVQGVFLADLENQKAHFIPVKAGIVNSLYAEILNPPLTGLVVTLGHHFLEDGTPIIISGEGPDDAKKPAEKRTTAVKKPSEEAKP